jgi:iron-sulfur cluster assembly protein
MSDTLTIEPTTLRIDPSQVVEPVVAVTESAQKQIRRVLAKNGSPGVFLRIGVKGGGCSGFSYVMKPDTEFDEIDRTWEIADDLRVVIDRKSIKFLSGATLDYSIKNLLEGGFIFDNPNAVKSCGCGSSFTVKS